MSASSFRAPALVEHEWTKYFDGKVRFEDDCIIWTRTLHYLGYGQAGHYRGEVKTHRISYTITNGPIPEGMVIRHKCDVRACVNPDHLEIGTQGDNVADMISRGRAVFPRPKPGAANPQAVLSEDDAWNIRFGLSQIFSQGDIARAYDASPMAISRLVRGQSWQHLSATVIPFKEARPQ